MRHLSDLEHLDLGFHRDHLLLMQIDPNVDYDSNRLALAYRQLMDRMEAIPGVRSATICRISPLEGVGASREVTVEGYQDRPGERRRLWENWVAPKYFKALETPLLGRDFKPGENGRWRLSIKPWPGIISATPIPWAVISPSTAIRRLTKSSVSPATRVQ